MTEEILYELEKDFYSVRSCSSNHTHSLSNTASIATTTTDDDTDSNFMISLKKQKDENYNVHVLYQRRLASNRRNQSLATQQPRQSQHNGKQYTFNQTGYSMNIFYKPSYYRIKKNKTQMQIHFYLELLVFSIKTLLMGLFIKKFIFNNGLSIVLAYVMSQTENFIHFSKFNLLNATATFT